MMEEPKTCPFCGSVVNIDRKPLWQESSKGVTHGYYGCFEFKVKCKECGCTVDYYYNDTIYRSEKEAIENVLKAWNRRANNETKLPKKHGRLIDADVLLDAMSRYHDNEGAKFPFGYDDTTILVDSACFMIEEAPTVVEAEDN